MMSSAAWIELNTDERIAELMTAFGNFHDACVREIHVESGHSVDRNLRMETDWRTTVHMLVQRQAPAPSAIEMRFEEVVTLQVVPAEPDCASIIFRATCTLTNGALCWADDRGGCRIEARRAWWRDASKWMGRDLRYRYPDARR